PSVQPNAPAMSPPCNARPAATSRLTNPWWARPLPSVCRTARCRLLVALNDDPGSSFTAAMKSATSVTLRKFYTEGPHNLIPVQPAVSSTRLDHPHHVLRDELGDALEPHLVDIGGCGHLDHVQAQQFLTRFHDRDRLRNAAHAGVDDQRQRQRLGGTDLDELGDQFGKSRRLAQERAQQLGALAGSYVEVRTERVAHLRLPRDEQRGDIDHAGDPGRGCRGTE